MAEPFLVEAPDRLENPFAAQVRFSEDGPGYAARVRFTPPFQGSDEFWELATDVYEFRHLVTTEEATLATVSAPDGTLSREMLEEEIQYVFQILGSCASDRFFLDEQNQW